MIYNINKMSKWFAWILQHSEFDWCFSSFIINSDGPCVAHSSACAFTDQVICFFTMNSTCMTFLFWVWQVTVKLLFISFIYCYTYSVKNNNNNKNHSNYQDSENYCKTNKLIIWKKNHNDTQAPFHCFS